jgi:phospholipid N-methyltransferase
MGLLSQHKLFFQQFKQHFFEVGAILPSSPALGRAAAAYLAQKQGPAQVLEVGAGTGAFTKEIAPLLKPGDSLDLVEINPNLMVYLRQQFQQQPQLLRPGVNLTFITEDIRQVAFDHDYDYIIFSLPLTNFPPAMGQEILDLMMTQLKPGGIFSHVRYAFIGRVKYLLSGAEGQANIRAYRKMMRQFAGRYQIDRRLVWLNVPPTWVFYWQKK